MWRSAGKVEGAPGTPAKSRDLPHSSLLWPTQGISCGKNTECQAKEINLRERSLGIHRIIPDEMQLMKRSIYNGEEMTLMHSETGERPDRAIESIAGIATAVCVH